jgi:hypothetical protein
MDALDYNEKRGYSRPEIKLIQTVVQADVDGVWGPKTVAAVRGFQGVNGLERDGLVGPQTWEAIQAEAEPAWPLDVHTERLEWVTVPADEYDGRGYDRHTLREDVAAAYMRVYQRLHDLGAVLTSSGSRRRLSARVNPNRSATSMHYVGRALDLFVYSGMQDPATDPYVITGDEESGLTVWARVSEDEEDPGARLVVLDPILGRNPTWRNDTLELPAINLTELFAQHGFHPIRPRTSFWGGSNYGGAEWWHFQYQEGLVEGVTTFGDELLRLYTVDELKDTAPWRYRRRTWGENWR